MPGRKAATKFYGAAATPVNDRTPTAGLQPERRGTRAGRRSRRYRWTTGQVRVRVMPSTAWTLATTSLPSSSTLRASARAITSYGPVTPSATCTPWIAPTVLATAPALPTSVWMRMYADNATPGPPRARPPTAASGRGSASPRGVGPIVAPAARPPRPATAGRTGRSTQIRTDPATTARAGRRRRRPRPPRWSGSVRARQAQGVLGHVVEDHLAAHRRGAQRADAGPHLRQAVLGGVGVAAMGLDGGVDRLQARLGGGELGHVGRLAGALLAVVVQPGGLLRHQPGQLDVDLRLGQRVGQTLVGTDRHVPDLALVGVGDRPGQRVAGGAVGAGRADDPLRVEPVEDLPQPVALVAEQPVGGHHHVVEEEGELLLGRGQADRDERLLQAGRVRVDDEQRQHAAVAALVDPGLGDHHDRLALVHARGVVLGAAEAPAVALRGGDGGQPVGVGAGVRLGDGA